MRIVVLHFPEPDGTVTAKCRKFPNLKTTAPSLAESKAKADAEVRRRIDDDAARVEHFANRGFDWWEAA